MDRLLLHQGGTINAFWERDGEAYDPGVTTVTVTNDAGTALVTAQATAGAGSTRSFTVTPAQALRLDYLTVTWTAADTSVLTTYAEVVGGYLFSVAQARRRSPLQDTSVYPVDQIVYYRTLAEMALEDVCGVAFVPRYSDDLARIFATGMIELPRRRVRSVRSMSTSTDAGFQVLNITGTRIMTSGLIYTPTYLSFASLPVRVCYEHGYDSTPPRVSRAALELARRWIIESPWDERMTAFRTREGGELDILTAKGDVFDIPEVVAVAEVYGTPMIA